MAKNERAENGAARNLLGRYGPWAVVTGASDGIGRSLAIALAQQGFSIVLVARRESALRELADELGRQYGANTRVIAADLSSAAETDRLDRETRDLDVGLLAAVAGFGTSGNFVDNDIAAELNMIDVNCRALAQSVHAFSKRFAARGRGGVLMMSSLFAFQGVPRAGNYAATKAYVQSLAEALHAELAPLGVDVLASAPGPVKSGFGFRAGMKFGSGQTPDAVALGSLRALGRRTTVRPGFMSKFLEFSLSPLPRGARTMILSRVAAGMTAH
jgi:short-subunit dehydrogenase